jgi:hypothetical protein
MAKAGRKGRLPKARSAVARAQNRYTKAVAKGERQIRDVRALVDEKVARAKAAFELCANELAEAERAVAEKAEKSAAKAESGKGLVVVAKSQPKKDGAHGVDGSPDKTETAGETQRVSEVHPVTGNGGGVPHS